MRRLNLMGMTLAVLLLPVLAHAGEQPEPLTWVRYFKVQPERGMDFVDLMKKHHGEMFGKLLADGAVMSWGIGMPFTLSGQQHTHSVWVTTSDWAGMEAFMQAMEADQGTRSEAEEESLMREFLAMVDIDATRDVILRHVVLAGFEVDAPASDAEPKYLRLTYYKAKPFQMENLTGLYTRLGAPVYRKLIGEGAILDAGLAVQEVVGQSGWTHVSWVLFGDLEAIDAMGAASDSADEARSEEEQAAIKDEAAEAVDWSAYHQTITRIVHFQSAKHGD